MATQSGRSNRHHQQDHIPSTSDNPSTTAAQPQIATQPDIEGTIQNCPCSWCSRPGYDHQAARYTGDYPAPWFPNNSVTPFANESPGITTVSNGQMMVGPVGQQAPEDDWNAFRYDAAGSLQAQTSAAPYQAQIDMPVLDNLRRFAERYFNNPESSINAVHFEYGPSGRLCLPTFRGEGSQNETIITFETFDTRKNGYDKETCQLTLCLP